MVGRGTVMRRDMELVRNLLLTIEHQSEGEAIYDLQLSGYDKKAIAYHCKLLYEAGLICDYDDQYADNQLWSFGVGALTWVGHDYVEKIRSETVWNKTKALIGEKGLPLVIDTVRDVATAVVTGMVQGAISGLK